ncbi:hypothetical protein FXF51_05830 [Nonomuraea sp. PA05]|uniref:hypothetical protein n=1 Tax=Nonomuraea sp. PA05 TaxID=2604466 RepID=UPI0011D77E8F|nr:hypothetical protein [Nonomuraea sp. PA05]TYB69679.1 hypothetical protein FXF51_05830 [Nonomuraea sp. PA05]
MRTLKPEAFSSETLTEVSVHARWNFAGLWTYADDEGRGRAEVRLIKAAVWPLDDDVTPREVAAFLDELEAAHLICRYESGGKQYLHIVNFAEHQKPNRPVASKLPECPKVTHGGLTEDSVSSNEDVIRTARSIGRALDCADLGAMWEVSEQISDAALIAAGQMAITEDSLRTHGAVERNSFTNTPTPTPLRTEGEGDVDGASEIGAEKSATSQETSEADGSAEDEEEAEPSREDVERLCRHLADRIVANGSKPPTVGKRWRNAARLMLDKDGRTEEQIHLAIDWCQNDEFWRSNILSMPTLRDQYDRLRLQAKNQVGRRSQAPSQRSTTDERVAQAQSLKERFRSGMPPTIQGEIAQ